MKACWWWLSFADPARPRGSQFLGVAAVLAADLGDAMSAAWRSGCNPGGQDVFLQPRDVIAEQAFLLGFDRDVE